MTDPIQRHRITTRYDDFTWATTGISADLEQQRRERTWRDRLPSATDVRAGTVIVAVILAIIAGLANLASIAVP